MFYWQIFGIVALIAIILEIVMPSFFFLNFAISGIITSIVSIWVGNFIHLLVIFAALSLISLLFFRPFFLEKVKPEDNQSGVESTYYGKIAKVTETVTKSSGAISIYDERWDARLACGDEEIPAGAEVKIVKNDSLIMYVEKI